MSFISTLGKGRDRLKTIPPLAILVFVVAVAYDPFVPSAAHVLRWAAVFVGAPLLLLRTPSLRPTGGHMLGVAFILYAAASITWSVSPWDSAGELLQFVFLGAAFCVAAEADTLDQAWTALAAGVGVNVVFAAFQFLGYRPLPVVTSYVAGTFLNKDFMAEAAVPALVAMLFARNWLLAAVCAVGVALPASRESVISLAAAGVVFAWGRFGAARALALAAFLAVAFLAFLRFDIHTPARLLSADARFLVWQVAWANLTWFGYGLNSFAALVPSMEYVHDEPLQFAFELGVGALPLFLFFGFAFLGPLSRERSMLAAVLAGSFVYFPLHEPCTALVVALLAGRLVGARRVARELELQRRERRRAVFFDLEVAYDV